VWGSLTLLVEWEKLETIGAYKFLDPDHVPNLMAGHIRLGSLRHYRKVEDRKLRDEMEGAQNYFQSEKITIDPRTGEGEPVRAKLAAIGIHARGRTTFVNSSFESQVGPMHIFSYSVGSLPKLAAQWTNYDGCVEIIDQERFAQSVLESGVLHSGPVIMPVRQMFRGILHGAVSYDAIPLDIVREEVSEPSPFRKGPAFSDERESRLALQGPVIELPDVIYVKIPNPNEVFQVVSSGLAGPYCRTSLGAPVS